MAVGPRAMVVASSKAIILLGASDVFRLSNIFFLRPGEQGPPSAAREVADCLFLSPVAQKNIVGGCFRAVAEMLKESESAPGVHSLKNTGGLTTHFA